MELTATDLRKNLFRTLDRTLAGEAVEITYKGARIRLIAAPAANGGGSKLARAIRRHALLVDPDSIVESDPEFLAALEKKLLTEEW